jgi:hypothetical protein
MLAIGVVWLASAPDPALRVPGRCGRSVAVAELMGGAQPCGTLLLANFRVPRGLAWRLLAELAGACRMEHATPGLELGYYQTLRA